MKGQPGNPGLKGRLVDKSVEAYILSLETINRLSIQYRIETFCYLICSAWELLLKAKIIEDSRKRESIFRKTQKGKNKRTLTLRECLNLVFPSDLDPERRNVERMADLRDEAVHLVFSEVPRDVLCLFQAGVINYHKRLGEWFNVSLADRVHVGMMTIVYDMQPGYSDMSNSRLRKDLGKDAADFLARYCAEVREEFDRLQRPARFSIGVEYRLVLTDKRSEADIVLSTSQTGDKPHHIVQIPKDPSKSHPLRQKEVLELLNSKLPALKLNQYDVQCVLRIHGIRNRPEFFYQGKVKGSPSQYSHAFVEWLLTQHRKDSKFYSNARSTARMLS